MSRQPALQVTSCHMTIYFKCAIVGLQVQAHATKRVYQFKRAAWVWGLRSRV